MDKHTHSEPTRGDSQHRPGPFPLPGFVGGGDTSRDNRQTARRVDAPPKVEDDDAAECRMENEGGPPPAPAPARATRQ